MAAVTGLDTAPNFVPVVADYYAGMETMIPLDLAALGITAQAVADTLADSGGVGLAAPQVGVLRRVCVVLDEEDQLIELVNPEIIYTEGEQTGLEGCLSVPGKYGVVTRPEVVRVRAQDRDGQWFEVEDEGLTARCFCHEIEHLDGHLFVEHTDRLMEGEELQKWLEEHADEYEIEGDEE